MAWGPIKWYHLADIACMCFKSSARVQTEVRKVLEGYNDQQKISLLTTDDDPSGLVKVFHEATKKLPSRQFKWDADQNPSALNSIKLRVRRVPQGRDDLKGNMLLTPQGIYLFWPLTPFMTIADEKIKVFEGTLDSTKHLLAEPFLLIVDNALLVQGAKSNASQAVKLTIKAIKAIVDDSADGKSDKIKAELKLFANPIIEIVDKIQPWRRINRQASGFELPDAIIIDANERRLHESLLSGNDTDMQFVMGLGDTKFLWGNVEPIITPQWPCCNLDPGLDC